MRTIIMPISQRLKEIRTYYLYTQEYMGSVLGLTQSTYAGWECNKKIIPLKHLNQLTNFYGLSIDYLLGLTDEKRKVEKVVVDKEVVRKNFTLIRKEKGLSTIELAKILNVGETTIRDYENGKYLISTHACYDLARNFNVSVDWLLGKSKEKYID